MLCNTYIACLVWIDPDKEFVLRVSFTLSLRLLNMLCLQRRGMGSGGVGSEFVSAGLLKVGSSGLIRRDDVLVDCNAFLFWVKTKEV